MQIMYFLASHYCLKVLLQRMACTAQYLNIVFLFLAIHK